MPEGGSVSFEYARPTDWSEAARLLTEPGAVAKMGGCDVLTRYRGGRLQARLLVGLNHLPGVGKLTFDGGACIGPAVTLAQLAYAPQLARGWPMLAHTVGAIASPAIRNSATLVGNVAQGWGVSDIVPLLQVYGAKLELYGPAGTRGLSVDDYAKMPGTGALQPGEAIVALKLEPASGDFRVVYERFVVKQAFALPLVSVAVGAALQDGRFAEVRVAAVGGARMPTRAVPVEAALRGQRLGEQTADAAITAILKWAEPGSDHRGSSDYRRHLLGVLLRRALSKFAPA